MSETRYANNFEYCDSLVVVNQIYFPQPVPGNVPLFGIQAVGNYGCRLQPGSPAIGKGFVVFNLLVTVPVDPVYGATAITFHGKDMGAFQFNGTGNQHHP